PTSRARTGSRLQTSASSPTVAVATTHRTMQVSATKRGPKRTSSLVPSSDPPATESVQPAPPPGPEPAQADESKKTDPPAAPAPPARDNRGKGQEKHPALYDTQSVPQPAPTDDAQSASDEEVDGNHGNGNGHGSGHK